jgi:uncharacterized membrane protein HdeD (DUF308 family)
MLGMHDDFPTIATDVREAARAITGHWWLWLLIGIAWLAVALVILQFEHASITTVAVLFGAMFTLAGLENIALARLELPYRWIWALFGVLFLLAGLLCFIDPDNSFAGIADMLGFLFLIVGVWWLIRAFLERPVHPRWWIGLVTGSLMIVLAFWTAGQFYIEKVYILLVLAGIWELMEGVTNIMRAFEIRSLHERITNNV